MGSTIPIFNHLRQFTTKMHIEHDAFKKVLPALGGEHIFDFHEFSFYRNQHAHRFCHFQKCASRPRWGAHFCFFIDFQNFTKKMLIEVACIFSVSNCLLEPLGIVLCRLGVNLGQTWVNLNPTWANLGPIWANLNPTLANLSQLVGVFGPTLH